MRAELVQNLLDRLGGRSHQLNLAGRRGHGLPLVNHGLIVVVQLLTLQPCSPRHLLPHPPSVLRGHALQAVHIVGASVHL